MSVSALEGGRALYEAHVRLLMRGSAVTRVRVPFSELRSDIQACWAALYSEIEARIKERLAVKDHEIAALKFEVARLKRELKEAHDANYTIMAGERRAAGA